MQGHGEEKCVCVCVCVLQVPIDLALTAFANAAVHYDARKKHVVKQVSVRSSTHTHTQGPANVYA